MNLPSPDSLPADRRYLLAGSLLVSTLVHCLLLGQWVDLDFPVAGAGESGQLSLRLPPVDGSARNNRPATPTLAGTPGAGELSTAVGGPPPRPRPAVQDRPLPAPPRALAQPMQAPSIAPLPPGIPALPRPQRRVLGAERSAILAALDACCGDAALGLQSFERRVEETLYRFTLTPSAAGETGLGQVRVNVHKHRDGRRYATELLYRRLAFSQFAQLVDRWEPGVALYLDVIDGRLHANSTIEVEADYRRAPLVTGRASTAARVRWTRLARRDQVFRGGLETGVEPIRLPAAAALIGDPAPEQRIDFGGDTRVILMADGRFQWWSHGGRSGEGRLPATPFFMMGARDARIEIEGQLRGHLVVYSPERIVITGDLRYTPGDHFLGLVSDRYVDIASPRVTGDGDLAIDAAVYARRRFQVRGYRYAAGANLTLHGSLAAGSLSATEPRFATAIHYDPRLESRRPARFPQTARYELQHWDRQWTLLPD